MRGKVIAATVGFSLMCCALAMQAPAWVDIFLGASASGFTFLWVSALTLMVGWGMFAWGRHVEGALRPKDMFLTTTLIWVGFIFFAALPFYFSGIGISPINALFESVSGLTTTGATVLSNLDHLPKGILLWRSLLQWMGGMGVVLIAVMVLPVLRVGGMNFFTTESSETADKNAPKVVQNMCSIVLGFCLLTLLCMLCLYVAGMDFFDACNHAMTCVANAGFSTHDMSIGYYKNPAIEWIVIFFMLISSLPLLVPFYVLKGYWHKIRENEQIKTFLRAVFLTCLLLWFVRWNGKGLEEGLALMRSTIFTVVSLMTTTGFVTENYNLWGGFPVMLLFFVMMTGGCTGSASGGIKMFRFTVLGRTLGSYFKGLIQPHGVFVPRYGGRPIGTDILVGVFVFLTCFILVGMTSTLILSLCGLDFLTSLSGAFSAVANVGPALGHLIGPDQTFDTLPDAAKGTLMITMILGRLEFTSVVILGMPFMWRKNA